MKRFTYEPKGVCPMQIAFDIENDKVYNIHFVGGCNGNLKAISKLLEGWSVDDIESKLKGNICGRRQTSCADQLAIAVRKAYEEQSS